MVKILKMRIRGQKVREQMTRGKGVLTITSNGSLKKKEVQKRFRLNVIIGI